MLRNFPKANKEVKMLSQMPLEDKHKDCRNKFKTFNWPFWISFYNAMTTFQARLKFYQIIEFQLLQLD